MENPGHNPVRISGSSLFGRLAFMFLLGVVHGDGGCNGVRCAGFSGSFPKFDKLRPHGKANDASEEREKQRGSYNRVQTLGDFKRHEV